MAPQPQYGYYGEQKKSFNWKILVVLAAGIGLILVLVFAIMALSSRNSISTQSAHLGVRLANLSTMTDGATKQLRSGDLQKINAEVSIITDGATTNLAGLLPKKADKNIIAEESDSSQTTRLSNAALAGMYDAQYKAVLTQKLESIDALLTEMYTKTNSKSTRALLNTEYKKYQTLLANLNKINV